MSTSSIFLGAYIDDNIHILRLRVQHLQEPLEVDLGDLFQDDRVFSRLSFFLVPKAIPVCAVVEYLAERRVRVLCESLLWDFEQLVFNLKSIFDQIGLLESTAK